MRNGEFRNLVDVSLPYVPGYEISGTIEETGSESQFKQGDEVVGIAPIDADGGCATFVSLPVYNVGT